MAPGHLSEGASALSTSTGRGRRDTPVIFVICFTCKTARIPGAVARQRLKESSHSTWPRA